MTFCVLEHQSLLSACHVILNNLKWHVWSRVLLQWPLNNGGFWQNVTEFSHLQCGAFDATTGQHLVRLDLGGHNETAYHNCNIYYSKYCCGSFKWTVSIKESLNYIQELCAIQASAKKQNKKETKLCVFLCSHQISKCFKLNK